MTMTAPTMPATNCPVWCEQDHAAQEWRIAVEICELLASRGIERDPAATFEPFHGRRLLDLQLEGLSAEVVLDWQAGTGEALMLYLDAQGALTAAQAREVAAALLQGAELYEVDA